MKNASLALLLALPVLAATAPVSTRSPIAASPTFAVEEGTTLVKVFEQNFDFALDSISMTMDGNDMSGMMGDLSMEQGVVERVEFTDTYHSMKGDKPAKLARTFVSLEANETSEVSSPQGDNSEDKEKSSELEGTTVIFEWDSDEEEYALSFAEDGSDDLLEDLEEDADLRGFLPEGEVGEGDSWEVDASAFEALFSPSGDLKFVGEDDEESEEDDGELNEQFEENLSGAVTATYKGTRKIDDVLVGVIEIVGELVSDAEQDVEQGPSVGSMVAQLNLDVEGQLLWNMEGGHFSSIELTAAMEMSMDTTMTIQDTHEMEQSMAFAGTVTFTASATPE